MGRAAGRRWATAPRRGPDPAARSSKRSRPARQEPCTKARRSGGQPAASRGCPANSLLARLNEAQAQNGEQRVEELLLGRGEISPRLLAQNAEQIHALPGENEVRLALVRFRMLRFPQVDQRRRGEPQHQRIELDRRDGGRGLILFLHHESLAAPLGGHGVGLSSPPSSGSSSSSAMLVVTGSDFSTTSGRVFKKRS